jgi:hypothetical protein
LLHEKHAGTVIKLSGGDVLKRLLGGTWSFVVAGSSQNAHGKSFFILTLTRLLVREDAAFSRYCQSQME